MPLSKNSSLLPCTPDNSWPLSNRDFFIVQDYVLKADWFFTYNHEISHPYFRPRESEGYVRFVSWAEAVERDELVCTQL